MNKLLERFKEISELKDGWHDGEGKSLDGFRLGLIAHPFLQACPECIPAPSVFPTPEGNLLFEWKTPSSPSVDFNVQTFRAEFHALGPNGKDVEASFLIGDRDDWDAFFQFLNKKIEVDL
jgi:hypothetical protein